MLNTGLDPRPAVEKELSGSIRVQQAPQLVAAPPVAARPDARALSSLHPPDRCARTTGDVLGVKSAKNQRKVLTDAHHFID
jgi:hypothetical protein